MRSAETAETHTALSFSSGPAVAFTSSDPGP
jgi:hypothetical protein